MAYYFILLYMVGMVHNYNVIVIDSINEITALFILFFQLCQVRDNEGNLKIFLRAKTYTARHTKININFITDESNVKYLEPNII